MSEGVRETMRIPLAESAFRTTARPFLYGLLLIAPVALFLMILTIGSVPIPASEALGFLFGGEQQSGIAETILWELRLPRAITALVCGAALGAAGLQMQTLFRNPLAGPWALGLTGGAQLGVAIVVATGTIVGSSTLERLAFINEIGIVTGAVLGSSAVAIVVAVASRHVSTMTLLIVGLMLGYLAEGLVSIVLHFTTEVQGRVFASWNDGSFAGVQWQHFRILIPCLCAGLLLAIGLVKPLNALLLGENYALSLGLPVRRARLMILMGAVLLAAPVTAYCGPVLFVGIVVPHMARGLLNSSDHRVLMPAAMLLGATLCLAADLVVHLPWERHVLHLNAVLAAVGAPFVIWLLVRNRTMRSMDI